MTIYAMKTCKKKQCIKIINFKRVTPTLPTPLIEPITELLTHLSIVLIPATIVIYGQYHRPEAISHNVGEVE